MLESPDISLRKPIQHPDQVKAHIKNIKGLDKGIEDKTAEQIARNLTARDLWLKHETDRAEKYKGQLSEDERLSLVDSLTGLPNHRALFGDQKANPPLIGRLEEFLSYAERSKEPFALAIIDLDHFKKYNDDYGHLAGNVALQELARVIRRVIRPSDFAARFGGEEFVVILPGLDREQARIVIERLRQAVSAMPSQGFKGVVGERVSLLENGITISAGLTDYSGNDPNIDSTPDALIKEADDLLYLAKKTGRDKVVSRNKSK